MLTLILSCTVASMIGGLASISFSKIKKISIYDMLLAITLGNASGLIIHYFFENTLELSIATSALIALFSIDVVNELREIIGKSSEVVDKVVDKKLEKEDKHE